MLLSPSSSYLSPSIGNRPWWPSNQFGNIIFKDILLLLLLLLKHFEFNLLTYGLYLDKYYALSSVQFSHSVVSNSLPPHELQDTRLPPCPSLTPRIYSNSCLPSCHPTISSFVVPFSSRPQSLTASRSFTKSQFFSSGGQSIGVSASVSVLPMNIQD